MGCDNMKDTEYTVKHLRKLLESVPDDATVEITYEGCCSTASEEESEGFDIKYNTFTIGCR